MSSTWADYILILIITIIILLAIISNLGSPGGSENSLYQKI